MQGSLDILFIEENVLLHRWAPSELSILFLKCGKSQFLYLNWGYICNTFNYSRMKKKYLVIVVFHLLLLSCNKATEKLEKQKQEKYEQSYKLIKEASDKYYENDFSSAERLFEEAVQADEYNPEAFLNRAYFIKEHKKNYSSAIQDYNRAIEILLSTNQIHGIHLWSSYKNRGECKQLLSDNRGAIHDFDKAIELKPEIGSTYLLRGISKFNLSDNLNEACLDWSKAGELGNEKAYDYIKEHCN